MKDKDLFPTFANFLIDELHTFFLCTEDEDRSQLPRELLENDKKYAWDFTNNFVMEYRDQFAFDVTSLHNFAIGFIRIVCSKPKQAPKKANKNLQVVRDYMKRAKLEQTHEAEINAIP